MSFHPQMIRRNFEKFVVNEHVIAHYTITCLRYLRNFDGCLKWWKTSMSVFDFPSKILSLSPIHFEKKNISKVSLHSRERLKYTRIWSKKITNRRKNHEYFIAEIVEVFNEAFKIGFEIKVATHGSTSSSAASVRQVGKRL